jgi:hypothetical protein
MFSISDPTALADQPDATGRDALAAIADMAALTGGPLTHTHPPAWLHGHLSAMRDLADDEPVVFGADAVRQLLADRLAREQR